MNGEPDFHPEAVEFHRNGVSGRGFWNVLFGTTVDGQTRTFLAIVPSSPEWGECLVLDADLVGQHNVGFGINSWRGDHYMRQVIEAINAHTLRENIEFFGEDGYRSEPIVVTPFWNVA